MDDVVKKTEVINGREGRDRGLRGKVEEQRRYRDITEDEKTYLIPERQHAETYRDILLKLNRALDARRKELLEASGGALAEMPER